MKSSISNRYIFLLFVIYIFPQPAFSQYLGGNANGFAINTLTQTVCPALASTNIYYGGNADGFALNTLTQTVCPPLPSTNIYYGGNADGFALNTLTQSVCPPLPSTNIFFGGNADGFAFNNLQQSNCYIALPIELLSWEAQCEQREVILKWTTASEINNDYFTIEKSIDGANWQLVGKVKGAGNSTGIKKYTFTDINSKSDTTVYYRLSQTNFDGTTVFFNEISVTCEDSNEKNVFVYPNPTSGNFNLHFINGMEETVQDIDVYTVLGQNIFHQTSANKSISVFQTINLSDYSDGIYFLKIQTLNGIITKKIMINKF
ncbi:MAG: T9SS type A sorting domain-containing protein [Bacteroidia bacterium]